MRLRDPNADPRRLHGDLVAAGDRTATVRLADGTERTLEFDAIDKARTVVDWTPPPKPGKGRASHDATNRTASTRTATTYTSTKEEDPS